MKLIDASSGCLKKKTKMKGISLKCIRFDAFNNLKCQRVTKGFA